MTSGRKTQINFKVKCYLRTIHYEDKWQVVVIVDGRKTQVAAVSQIWTLVRQHVVLNRSSINSSYVSEWNILLHQLTF